MHPPARVTINCVCMRAYTIRSFCDFEPVYKALLKPRPFLKFILKSQLRESRSNRWVGVKREERGGEKIEEKIEGMKER